MNAEDLDRIEQAIGRKLPEDYRETMRHYAFGPDDIANDMLDDDADSLIRANQEPHDILRDRRPTSDYLWIGCDGGESYYYIDLRVTSSPVYEFDLEVGNLTSCADNLGDFVSKCRSIDQELEEEEQLASQKRWWRFW